MEIVEYRATSKKRTERRVVSEVRRGQILPGTSDYWEGVSMRVPALPPTKLAGACSIIDVQYRLEFHVEPKGPAFDLVVGIPIIIGKGHLISLKILYWYAFYRHNSAAAVHAYICCTAPSAISQLCPTPRHL